MVGSFKTLIKKNIIIIPLNNNCYINGMQEYSLFNIEPLLFYNNSNTYIDDLIGWDPAGMNGIDDNNRIINSSINNSFNKVIISRNIKL